MSGPSYNELKEEYIKKRSDVEMTELMQAASDGDLQAALDFIPTQRRWVNKRKKTALMMAVISGKSIECIEKLSVYESKMVDFDGNTALIYAVLNRRLEAVNVLTSYEIRIRNNKGETALMKAVEMGFNEAVDILAKYEMQLFNNSNLTALSIAAIKGNLHAVKILKTSESRITINGTTALMYAAQNKHLKIIEELLPFESNIPNLRDNNKTALMYAVLAKHVEAVKLLAPHESMFATRDLHKTAIMLSIENDDRECFDALIDYELNSVDNEHNTPLMIAVINGKNDVVKALAKTLCKKKDIKGRTALMKAIILNKLDIADELIKYGIGDVDKEGKTALIYAVENDCKSIFSSLSDELKIRTSDGYSPEDLAAKMGNLEILKLLIDLKNKKGESLEPTQITTESSAMCNNNDSDLNNCNVYTTDSNPKANENEEAAIPKEKEENVVLLENINFENSDFITTSNEPNDKETNKAKGPFTTPLIEAVKNNNVAIVTYLVEQRYGLCGKNSKGETALMYAAKVGSLELLNMLLDYERGLKDNNGNTALMFAVLQDDLECTKKLAKYEAGLQNNMGYTALMKAVENDKVSSVKLLVKLENGLKNIDGKTALMIAAQTKTVSVTTAKELITYEKNIETENKETALTFARQYNTRLVNLLY